MKKIQNKRWIILGSLVLVVVMATTGMAVSGFKGAFGPMGKGHMKERVLSRLDYAMQEIGMTSDQQVKYSAIRKKISAKMDEAMARRGSLRDAVRAEMQKEQPDVRMLAKTMKQEVRIMPDDISYQIDAMVEIYNILDKGQQAQFVKMIKDRMDRMDRMHSRRGHDGSGEPRGPRGPMEIEEDRS